MEAKEYEGGALRYVVMEPDEYDPDRSYPLVVLLHGFGSHMGDLAGLCPALERRRYLYALPNAPTRIDLGFGSVGFAWTSPAEGEDDGTAADSERKLTEFFEEVTDRYRVLDGAVVLGGFSQGGRMTYRVGLPRPLIYKGLAGLSARMAAYEKSADALPVGRDQSIFISHGDQDTIIPLEDGRSTRDFLVLNGYAPEYREYEMAHEITGEVLGDLADWLHRTLPNGDEVPLP